MIFSRPYAWRLIFSITLIFAFALCALPFQAGGQILATSDKGKLVEVTKYWAKLLDDGQLPGMNKDDHGKAEGFHLTPAVIKSWSDILDKNMVSDLKDCEDAYLISVVTKDERNLRYFFCAENKQTKLISAYSEDKNGWHKLPKK